MPMVPNVNPIDMNVQTAQIYAPTQPGQATAELGSNVMNQSLDLQKNLQAAQATQDANSKFYDVQQTITEKKAELSKIAPDGFMHGPSDPAHPEILGPRLKNEDGTDRTASQEFNDFSNQTFKDTDSQIGSLAGQNIFRARTGSYLSNEMAAFGTMTMVNQNLAIKNQMAIDRKNSNANMVSQFPQTGGFGLMYDNFRNQVGDMAAQTGGMKPLNPLETQGLMQKSGEEISELAATQSVIKLETDRRHAVGSIDAKQAAADLKASIDGHQVEFGSNNVVSIDENGNRSVTTVPIIGKPSQDVVDNMAHGMQSPGQMMDPDRYDRIVSRLEKFRDTTAVESSKYVNTLLNNDLELVNNAKGGEDITDKQIAIHDMHSKMALANQAFSPHDPLENEAKYRDENDKYNAAVLAKRVQTDEFHNSGVQRQKEITQQALKEYTDRMSAVVNPNDPNAQGYLAHGVGVLNGALKQAIDKDQKEYSESPADFASKYNDKINDNHTLIRNYKPQDLPASSVKTLNDYISGVKDLQQTKNNGIPVINPEILTKKDGMLDSWKSSFAKGVDPSVPTQALTNMNKMLSDEDMSSVMHQMTTGEHPIPRAWIGVNKSIGPEALQNSIDTVLNGTERLKTFDQDPANGRSAVIAVKGFAQKINKQYSTGLGLSDGSTDSSAESEQNYNRLVNYGLRLYPQVQAGQMSVSDVNDSMQKLMKNQYASVTPSGQDAPAVFPKIINGKKLDDGTIAKIQDRMEYDKSTNFKDVGLLSPQDQKDPTAVKRITDAIDAGKWSSTKDGTGMMYMVPKMDTGSQTIAQPLRRWNPDAGQYEPYVIPIFNKTSGTNSPGTPVTSVQSWVNPKQNRSPQGMTIGGSVPWNTDEFQPGEKGYTDEQYRNYLKGNIKPNQPQAPSGGPGTDVNASVPQAPAKTGAYGTPEKPVYKLEDVPEHGIMFNKESIKRFSPEDQKALKILRDRYTQ